MFHQTFVIERLPKACDVLVMYFQTEGGYCYFYSYLNKWFCYTLR